MRIQHNITAMNSYRNYTNNANKLSKNLEKLSSGYKINRAGDDAAGLAISEKMRSQITGLNAAQKNVKDGISLVKTAEGALQEVHDMLNRMTYLATQSANGTYDGDVDRPNLQKELDALRTEIDRIADSSNFNGQKLLNGELTATVNGTFSNSAESAQAGSAHTNATVGVLTDGTTSIGATVAGKLNALTKISMEDGYGTKIEIDLTNLSLTSSTSRTNAVKAIQAKVTEAVDAHNNAGVASKADYVKISGLTVTGNGSGFTIGAASGTKQIFKQTSVTGGLTLQIGDTAEDWNKLTVGINNMHADDLGIGEVNISTQEGAQTAIDSIKAAIDTVSETRGQLGAYQNRLEHTNNNLAVMEENIQDAESTIRDTDVADEMTAYTKNNILLQSAQAMLAQANQMPQGVLQLLG